ncbi:SprT family protein [Paenibacillus campi]|uniref:SprT family protein n=1 Tax=Paenibacillus campi TaxID=3106031 RepID=UPI002AFF88CD|nr:SprT family protein [Paenibacillus sp. SGZ-1014]
MTNEELQTWVEQLSLQHFERPFVHQAVFNTRLRTTGGRYFLKSHNIEINPHQLVAFGHDEVEKIIKHELCHYHLHILGRGYQHKDAEFKHWLQRVGGGRYCQIPPHMLNTKRQELYRYRLVCRDCGTQYLRKRRMNPSKYCCGKCGGKLTLESLDLPRETW